MPGFGQEHDYVWTPVRLIRGDCQPPPGHRLRGDESRARPTVPHCGPRDSLTRMVGGPASGLQSRGLGVRVPPPLCHSCTTSSSGARWYHGAPAGGTVLETWTDDRLAGVSFRHSVFGDHDNCGRRRCDQAAGRSNRASTSVTRLRSIARNTLAIVRVRRSSTVKKDGPHLPERAVVRAARCRETPACTEDSRPIKAWW